MTKSIKKAIKKYIKLNEKLDALYAEAETDEFLDPDDIRGSEMDLYNQINQLTDLIPLNVWMFLNFGTWKQEDLA